MTLDFHNGVSIAEVVIYTPCLAVAILLSFRHGFRRNAGWLFLIVFCLARIIGPCMQLATISQPTNVSLYTGSAILQNIGLSPLELAAIGLISRCLDSIHKSVNTFVDTRILKIIELLILVGLILGIVGGIDAGNTFETTGTYQPGTLNKAGTSLFIVSYLCIVLATVLTFFSISHAEEGEKRLLFAVAVSLPFLLVRLIFSIFSTFTKNKNFNLLDGNVTVLLCVALIEELIVVLVFEGVGLTLHQVPKEQHVEATHQVQDNVEGAQYPARQQNQSGGSGNKVLNIAKKTIIGRILMSFVPDNSNRDLEMQREQYVQK
jgi:hypothetical protein